MPKFTEKITHNKNLERHIINIDGIPYSAETDFTYNYKTNTYKFRNSGIAVKLEESTPDKVLEEGLLESDQK